MKNAAGSVVTMLLSVLMIGCGGAITGSAPPAQTGADSQNAQDADPTAGVAFDEELMQKGMKK